VTIRRGRAGRDPMSGHGRRAPWIWPAFRTRAIIARRSQSWRIRQGETPVKLLVACLVTLCCTVTIALAASADLKPAAVPGGKVADAKAVEVDSLPLLEKSVGRDSTKLDVLFRLGTMYMDRDRPGDAVKVLSKVAAKRPKDVRVLVNLGAAEDASGHANGAQQLYRRALEVSPGDSIATCRLASSLYSAGKQQDAVDLLRSLIERKPGSYCAYFTLGVAFADAGIYRDAIRMWKKVVELAPGSPEAVSAQESIEVLQKFVQP
jgi:cytochrome c-type biogenesis protein CcmH/NrfG